MLKKIDLRFFTYCYSKCEVDICEITEKQFLKLNGVISYERHSVFENGCRQVCITIQPDDYPYFNELERP